MKVNSFKRQDLKLGENGKIVSSTRHDMYTEEELSFVEQMKELNMKGKSSETICETPEMVKI